MQYYAQLDGNGMPIAFYVDAISGPRRQPLYRTVDVFETVDVFDTDPETGDIRIVGQRQEKISERQEMIGEEDNPDCKIPADAVPITEEQHAEFINNHGLRRWESGTVVPYAPPAQPLTVADYSNAVQMHLDTKARERQYDGIQTAITYRGDPNPQFSAEGEALFAWRSAVWTYSTAELVKVLAGERPQPRVEDFMAELPAFEWPS